MTEKMKPSGIGWIGDIPESWEPKKVKYIFDVVNGSTPDSGDFDCWDGDISWITPADMNDTGTISCGERTITKRGYNSCGTSMLPEGSVVISCRAPIGKINITEAELCTNQGCKSLVSKEDNRYFYYLLLAGQDQLVLLGRGTTFLELATNDLRNYGVVVPSKHEQCAIADYLDTQCAKIDSVIADIEKQIELLQKYKKSLITETVTKGLDRSVPMKDSGIEWIGNVLAHWQVKRLSYECERIGDIDHYMPDSVDNGIPYIMTGDLIGDGNQIDFENCKQISEQDYLRLSRKMKPIRNDIIFARYATIGTVRIVDFDKEFLVSYSCAIVRPKETLHSKYLFYYLKSTAFYEEISKYINTNTQGNVGIDSLGRAKIPVPLIEEQVAISDFLDKKCELIDNVLSHKQRQLEVIQQHKKSLIYEYVTGKKRVKEVG